ncbi:hypothetical protein FE257_006833 [Aspergillus nanangensis]|uniref:Uncharacterized protein n=1 Tax=Aspergillus nanangensis TaxID=2582783 RepID=A0AAD4CNU6_ASPNN|nr:hypothetical protein FE257_006833 [Aspergillus nanangensis]
MAIMALSMATWIVKVLWCHRPVVLVSMLHLSLFPRIFVLAHQGSKWRPLIAKAVGDKSSNLAFLPFVDETLATIAGVFMRGGSDEIVRVSQRLTS